MFIYLYLLQQGATKGATKEGEGGGWCEGWRETRGREEEYEEEPKSIRSEREKTKKRKKRNYINSLLLFISVQVRHLSLYLYKHKKITPNMNACIPIRKPRRPDLNNFRMPCKPSFGSVCGVRHVHNPSSRIRFRALWLRRYLAFK